MPTAILLQGCYEHKSLQFFRGQSHMHQQGVHSLLQFKNTVDSKSRHLRFRIGVCCFKSRVMHALSRAPWGAGTINENQIMVRITCTGYKHTYRNNFKTKKKNVWWFPTGVLLRFRLITVVCFPFRGQCIICLGLTYNNEQISCLLISKIKGKEKTRGRKPLLSIDRNIGTYLLSCWREEDWYLTIWVTTDQSSLRD